MAHILIVDDDDIAAEHASHVLMDAGHACGWVTNSASALSVIAKRRPNLILLDQTLPRENGTAFLRRLRNSPKYYDLPVIMLTGAVGFKEEQIARYHGAQDYIRKPFSAQMLVFRVNQILKTHTGHRAIGERTGVERERGPTIPPMRMI